MKKIWKRAIWWALGLAFVGTIIMAFLPKPVGVEAARATRGAMQVTVEAEGETRVRDRYTLAAPVTGRLARIDLVEGSAVKGGAAVAMLYPPALDAMQREELERRIEAAESVLRQAVVAVDEASARLGQATRERDRLREVVGVGAVARQDLDRAEDAVTAGSRELEAARFRAQGAASEAAVAKAGRMALAGGHAVVLRSPAGGRVLRVLEKSERMVQAGTPILQIGDPMGLEIVIDLLSSDAVKVEPGAAVMIEGWGGDEALRARVKYIEPAAFTKVSALGIEEQRVNVIAELVEPMAKLGDGYRVDAQIVLWEGKNILKVPTSALFRDGSRWSLYTIEDGVAHRRPVKIGRINPFEAEVTGGIKEGSRVIVHPPDKLSDGGDVEIRGEARE